MTSNKREEYVAKLQAKLDEWNAAIDELEAKARQHKARHEQRNAERLTELKNKRDEARDKLDEFRGAADDAWENLKSGIESVWDDITRTAKETKQAFQEGLDEGKSSS